MFIENKLILNEKQKCFIDHVLSEKFPWYYQIAVYGKLNPMIHAHTLMNRHESNLDVCGTINSSYFGEAMSLFNSFCEQNNIEYNTIFRSGINSTTGSKLEHIGFHKDHDNFQHNVFLMYFNDVSKGDTIISNLLNDGKEIVVKPEKYKAVVFSGVEHTHTMCDVDERRVVLVITFR